MKVILNSDVKHLGEEGDVKIVANGYFRNFLFPRNLAVPYNAMTVAYFESKKEEIEAKKAAKRENAASLKEKLDNTKVVLAMPCGKNGKLFGAVTNQTVADYLNANGFEIERKKIEIPGLTIKNIGKYTATVRLYEAACAEVEIDVIPQETSEKADEGSADKGAKTSEKAAEKTEVKAEEKAEETTETPAEN